MFTPFLSPLLVFATIAACNKEENYRCELIVMHHFTANQSEEEYLRGEKKKRCCLTDTNMLRAVVP